MSSRGNSSLVRKAAEALARGPKHTRDLAREVLGLSGHDGAASAAVFQILGTDPRFVVDPTGVWTLDPTADPPPEPPSFDAAMPFAEAAADRCGRDCAKRRRIWRVGLGTTATAALGAAGYFTWKRWRGGVA